MNVYNLLITGQEGAWDGADYVFDLSRYLESTDDDLKAEFGPLDDDARTKLTSLPTLFAYEAPVNAPARVGWIQSIQRRDSKIRITFQFDSALAPIPPEKIEAMAWDLEIGGWELNRTHWAMKKADLLGALNRVVSGAVGAGVPPYASKQMIAAAEVVALTQLAPERDLEAVARAVRDAIEKNAPVSGLDRLHTFCTTLVRSLCKKRGITTPHDKPLHSLFGEYVKSLRGAGQIESEMTERILKSSISVLESFNDVRNNQSLAYDNVLLDHNEALLIFHHVIDLLRFVKELEDRLRRREEAQGTGADKGGAPQNDEASHDSTRR
jgi:hypothetical protein